MFGSLRNSTANKSATHTPPAAPSAFTARTNAFAPPPTRRAPPVTSAPLAQTEPEEETEEEGEWVEALYDYSSEVCTRHFRVRHFMFSAFSRILRILKFKPTSEYW
jgi:hypothetical protein